MNERMNNHMTWFPSLLALVLYGNQAPTGPTPQGPDPSNDRSAKPSVVTDSVSSKPAPVLGPCAVIQPGASIGVVGSVGMSAAEFAKAIEAAEKGAVRSILVELSAINGRHDSMVDFIRAIKDAQTRGLQIVAFVTTDCAETWCIALSCNQWVGSAAAVKSMSSMLDQGPGNAPSSRRSVSPPLAQPRLIQGLDRTAMLDSIKGGTGGSTGGMQGRRKPPGGSARETKAAAETLVLLESLLATAAPVFPAPVLDRKEALQWCGGKQVEEFGDAVRKTQVELEKIDKQLTNVQRDVAKQRADIASAKQQDGPRAEALKKRLESMVDKAENLVERAEDLLKQP